ncbi:putative nuclear RNA binding protein [Aspergillus vadensis CBS 113365]|uniref:Nuclear RNA binding protein n=1 Tax=Aspergillus vadensis (strain CBS 113365 / IMI 142717 / IBT 24658) TaxID=1448311 RepID=A0A319C476_ASPVC|nr:nuclear RNA binding protein [Aspergillus vadensis CBS 113365]PYH63612.1 nuclear RNA binding protein [Aspergillus vadensis CBS 113365]
MTDCEAATELASDPGCTSTTMDLDPLDTDRQLEQTLQSTCADHAARESRTRKHARNVSESSLESGYSTDESGRFDDAEELDQPPARSRSPSAHSAKRRRSNDWPLQQRDDAQATDSEAPAPKENPSGGNTTATTTTTTTTTGYRKPFHSANSRSSGSPRTSRHMRQAGPSARGRRSRFVEGSMNDSVSEKPPSIFMRDDVRHNSNGQRPSGIFRFGKAIASAFNPFGAWGSKAGPADGGAKQPGDPLSQAERAYAELKKSGYKGTVKGSYLQNLNAQSNTPQRSWNPIPEQMEYRPVGTHSRQNSGELTESGNSLRSSIQELRKAKSSLGIPLVRRQDSNKFPEELEGSAVRRQKSRKELQRQAKLMKRVSDLEIKLERARRELRELVGEEQEVLAPMPLPEIPYPRKFVPGALPSLPSERLLYQAAATVSPTSLRNASAPVSSLTNPPSSGPHELAGTPHLTPKTPKERQGRSSLSADSPSLKRKSPDPESLKTSQQKDPKHSTTPGTDKPSESEEATTPRRTKLPKMLTSDSPGSVERKQSKDISTTVYSSGEERGRRRSQPLRSASTRSPSARRRASNSRNRVQPSLRMKKARSDLRSASASEPPQDDKENHDYHHQSDSIPTPQDDTSQGMIEPETKNEIVESCPHSSSSSPSASPSKKKQARYEYIPPVPPLPKDLSATAAKVDRRIAKEMGKKREARDKARALAGGMTEEGENRGSFQWPEDFF